MARPQKEGLDYFPHDTDAVNDEKIEALRSLYGNDGYAFYFILLERIYRSNNQEIDVSDAETIQILCRKIEVTSEKFNSMLETSIKWGCFDREVYHSEGVLTSNGIKKRAGVVVKKREEMRKKYQSDKGGVSDAETRNKPDKGKESKEKESKEKEQPDSYTLEFENFWNQYPRKTEKKAAFTKWKSAKRKGASADDLITSATNYADWCKREGTEERYIKHAKTFLGPDEHWREYLKQRASLHGTYKNYTNDAKLREEAGY